MRRACRGPPTARAVSRPVYFVREDWYNREYAPRYVHHQEWHGDGRDRHDHGYDHDDR